MAEDQATVSQEKETPQKQETAAVKSSPKAAAQKKDKKPFWKNMKAEYRKVIWPDKKTAMKETSAVIVWSICVGLLVAVLDTVIKFGLGFIL